MASAVTIPNPFEDMASSPLVPMNRNRSWHDLRQAVRHTRKLQTTLINKIPHSFTFRHVKTESGIRTRLYFLGVPATCREHTLLYTDLPSEPQSHIPQLQWSPLMESFTTNAQYGQLSKEEQLLRERKRLVSMGITSYDHYLDTGKFAFMGGNNLYWCEDKLDEGQLQTNPVWPLEAKLCCSGAKMDPRLCPSNPNLLAFIGCSDIWVVNLATGLDKRLTFTHKGGKPSEDPRSAGVPSFVVQEEFDRYTGYWWQPERRAETEGNKKYCILYEEVDESQVEILHIVSAAHDETGVDEYRYPRAGTPNARCTLKMLEFEVDEVGALVNVLDKHLSEPLFMTFPWMEYIVRAGWTPDGEWVYAQLLDRKQQRSQLVLIPPQLFQCADSPESQPTTSQIQVIYEDTSNVWVNVHDVIHFFPQESPSEIKFLWANEKTGFRHLYHVTAGLQGNRMPESLRPNILKELMVTNGEWEVLSQHLWVDEQRKLVYFLGLKDTPLETHLYVVSYENPGSVVRLTELGFSHTIAMDKDCSMFVSTYSSLQKPPSGHVFRILFTDDGQIIPHIVGHMLESQAPSESYPPPEVFSFVNSEDVRFYGLVYIPHNLEPNKKYPVVQFVYGGPQVQLVSNSYKGLRFPRLHTLASLGYAVVVLDSRGSSRRGLGFESHIKNRLGTVEIEDQVAGLMWLSSQLNYLDLSRVAIHGWSYGGYMSLMALAQRPDIYKASIAGAPVTKWTLYDTGYTERYMGLPGDNEEGYRQGSVVDLVDKFPNEENRLLIVHGLIDENVHFYHTSVLVNALVKACKPYQLQIYPNERHGIRNADASEHYETMVLSFLQKNL